MLLLLLLSRHQWNNSPSRARELPRTSRLLARHPSRQRQRLGSPLAGGGCSEPLHLLLQRRRGAAPGWQCLLLEQRQTSSQSWGSCNWGITGVSMELLILSDQSSTPEMSAGFLLCCRSQRVCCRGETHRPGRGSAAPPWGDKEPLYFQWQLTHAYESCDNGLCLLCVGNCKWTPTPWSSDHPPKRELCANIGICCFFTETPFRNSFSRINHVFITVAPRLAPDGRWRAPARLCPMAVTWSRATAHLPALHRAHTGFDLFN